jgi:hypothetical protein
MIILPLAVQNMSITYKITIIYTYLFTQATRVTNVKGGISSKYKEGGCFSYPTKAENHTYFAYFLFLMFHKISTLQILFFPFKSQIIY